MDSKVHNIRPHLVPAAPDSRKRRGARDQSSQKTFELGGENATPPPDADSTNTTPSPDRSVTPLEPDETGARLDVTG